MSLTISPQALAAGFNPKTYPIAPPKKVPPDSGMETNLTNTGIQVDLSHLEIVKIIPEGGTDRGNNVSSDKRLINNRTALNTNADSGELVEKIIDPETGEEVRETSDTNQ